MFDLEKIKGAGLDEVIRQMPAAVIVVEAPSGKTILSNRRAQEIMEQNLGRPVPSELGDFRELRDSGDFEVFHPDGRAYEPEEWPLTRSIRTGEEVRDEEYFYTLADGTRFWLRSDCSPIHDDEGRIVAGVAIVHDITEQKRAEEELKEREERFRATFEQAAVGMAHTALDGRWLRVNQRLCDILGYTREELLQKTFQDVTHPDDLEPNLGYTRQLLAGDIGSFSIEKRYICKDGSIVWANLTVSVVREPSGEPSYGIAVIEDITERKKAEEALRESEGHLRFVLEAGDLGSWELDLTTYEQELSETCKRTFGLPPGADLPFERLLSMIHPDDRDPMRGAVEAAIATGGDYEADYRITTPGGEVRWVAARGRVVYAPDGAPSSMTGITLDITKRKRDEGRLRESSRRIENILESTTDAFFALNREWRFTYINERGLRQLQEGKGEELTREELLGKNAWELYPELVGSVFYHKYHEALREQKPVEFEAYAQLRERWYEVHAYPSEEGLAIYRRDITERKRAEEHLAYHARLLENIKDAVLATDEQFTLTAWNKGAEQMLGWRADEALGRKVYELIPTGNSDEEMAQTLRELTETGRFRGEMLMYRKDGTPVYTEALTIALWGEQGEITGYVNITRDITERKHAERELQESKRRNEEILESITDGFYAMDRHWRFTYLNARAVRFASQLAGEEFTHEGLLGRTLWETLPATVGTKIEEQYRRAVRDQQTVIFEYPYPVGGPIFEVNAYPSEQGLSIYFRDITERKRAEKEIETRSHQQAIVSELGLRALANDGLRSLIDDAVALVAETLEVEYSEFAELLPGGEEVLLRAGVGWQEGLVGNATVRAGSGSLGGLTLLLSEPVTVEDLSTETRFDPPPILHEHGIVSSMGVPIHGRDGPLGALGAFTTSRRTFSEDDVNFLQAVANVLATAVEREEAEEKLREVREAERSRMARVLHDEALQDVAYAMSQAQLVRTTSEEPARRLERLSTALKRVEQQLRGAIYDLRLGREQDKPFAELLESLVELHRTMASDYDIRLEMQDGVPSGPLGKTGTELLRIIGEALTNARRHSVARNVRVAVWSSEDKLRAEVSDDGLGFDQATTAGTGIRGMRERARILGGNLQIKSEPGKGTEVRFELALVKDRKEPEEEVRILLVEDHAAVREAIASSFEREAGFELAGQAGSLAEARRMLEEVDVAVVDLGLPDGYGGDLIGDLREANPQAQALVLSASLDRAEIARAVESGAAGILHKTAHLDEVVEAVRRLRAGEALLPLEEVVELLRFAGREREQEYEARQAIASLTPREKEVLQALAEGLDSQGIAERLNISLRTERNHMARILAKLGVHSQLQALVFAVRHGLVEIS